MTMFTREIGEYVAYCFPTEVAPMVEMFVMGPNETLVYDGCVKGDKVSSVLNSVVNNERGNF